MNKYLIILIILVIFIALDKGLTYFTLKAVEKNHPDVDHMKVERNPVMRWLFIKTGLGLGSVIAFILTVPLNWWIFGNLEKVWNTQIALYIMFMVYAFVIFNNTFFLLKHSGVGI